MQKKVLDKYQHDKSNHSKLMVHALKDFFRFSTDLILLGDVLYDLPGFVAAEVGQVRQLDDHLRDLGRMERAFENEQLLQLHATCNTAMHPIRSIRSDRA